MSASLEEAMKELLSPSLSNKIESVIVLGGSGVYKVHTHSSLSSTLYLMSMSVSPSVLVCVVCL